MGEMAMAMSLGPARKVKGKYATSQTGIGGCRYLMTETDLDASNYLTVTLQDDNSGTDFKTLIAGMLYPFNVESVTVTGSVTYILFD